MDTFLTVDEVALKLRIEPASVVILCRSGDLRATKPGRQWLISESDLRAYLDAGFNRAAS